MANVYDGVKEEMVVFADEGFAKVDWHPINLRLNDGAMECPHGGGDRFIEAHFGVLLQVGDAPSLARLQKWRCLIS